MYTAQSYISIWFNIKSYYYVIVQPAQQAVTFNRLFIKIIFSHICYDYA